MEKSTTSIDFVKIQTPWERTAKIAFIGLATYTAFSWFCYLFFLKNPENLSVSSLFPTIFSYAFQVFSQLHVVLCATVLFLLFKTQLNKVFWKCLIAVYCISLSAELGGTSVGILFGHYTYSGLLGPKIFNLVPMLIPLSWFLVSSCAFGFSAALFSGKDRGSQFKRVVSTALLILLWDLTLDPAMSHVFSYWAWNVPGGIYFGAPWTNFIGWTITGLVIGLALNYLKFSELTKNIPKHILLAHYFLFTALSSGFLLLAGVYLPVAIAFSGYLVWGLLANSLVKKMKKA